MHLGGGTQEEERMLGTGEAEAAGGGMPPTEGTGRGFWPPLFLHSLSPLRT